MSLDVTRTTRATSGCLTETERQLLGGKRAYWKLQLCHAPVMTSSGVWLWPAGGRPASPAATAEQEENTEHHLTNTPPAPDLPRTTALTALQCRIN